MFKKTISIAAATAFVLVPYQSLSAPTIKGVEAIFEGDSQVYSDTSNENVLWVTPETSGTLTLSHNESIFVTKDTCESASTVLRRKNRFATEIEKAEAKAFKAQDELDAGTDGVTQSDVDAIWNTVDDYENRLSRIKFDDEIYKFGGLYSYIASSSLSKNLESIRSRQPAGVTVQTIQTNVTSITPSLTTSDGAAGLTSNEIILKVGVPDDNDLAAIVDSIQIDVEMTKLGACLISFPDIMTAGAEPFKFGFVVNYEHPFLFSQNVSANYSLKKVYDRIEVIKKKKRLFKNKTLHSITESTELSSDLNVTVISDTPIGPELQLKLEQRARELVLNVAVTEMLAKFKEAGIDDKSGAQVAAEELQNACGPNPYCQGAAVGLKILDGIFGGSESRSELLQTLDHNVTYSSITGQALPVARSISYVAK